MYNYIVLKTNNDNSSGSKKKTPSALRSSHTKYQENDIAIDVVSLQCNVTRHTDKSSNCDLIINLQLFNQIMCLTIDSTVVQQKRTYV